MNFSSFRPIIAKCSQGQPLNGVQKGGSLLYKNIFSKTCNNPIILTKELFDSYIGYNIIYKLSKENKHQLVLGGDHSIGAPSVLASLYKYPDITVIWIDAHADINTIRESKSKNRHGTPLAPCFGLENPWFDPTINHILKPSNLYYVGIRDLDNFEKYIIKKYYINIVTPDRMVQIINKSKTKFHISFDVDALDPFILNSTGTTAPHGLLTSHVKNIIGSALNQNKLVGLDVCEFNPLLGNKNKSMNSIIKIFS